MRSNSNGWSAPAQDSAPAQAQPPSPAYRHDSYSTPSSVRSRLFISITAIFFLRLDKLRQPAGSRLQAAERSPPEGPSPPRLFRASFGLHRMNRRRSWVQQSGSRAETPPALVSQAPSKPLAKNWKFLTRFQNKHVSSTLASVSS